MINYTHIGFLSVPSSRRWRAWDQVSSRSLEVPVRIPPACPIRARPS